MDAAPLSCGGHAFECHEATGVVDEVLRSDLSSCSDDADRPHDPVTRRGLLSSEYMLDAGANLVLLPVS
jgi:hypothetical protein